MMKRQYSGRKILIGLYLLILAVTLTCLAACGGYAFFAVRQELEYCNEAAVDLYQTNLDILMEELENFDGTLCANNAEFARLSLKNVTMSTAEQINTIYNLRTQVNNRATGCSAVYVFNQSGTVDYYRIGTLFYGGIYHPEIRDAMDEIRAQLLDRPEDTAKWFLYETPSRTLLVHHSSNRGRFSCSMIDIQAFSDSRFYVKQGESTQFAFFTKDRILTNEAYLREQNITLEEIWSASDGTRRQMPFRRMLFPRYNSTTGIGVCGVLAMTGVRAHVRTFFGILVLSLLSMGLLFLFVYAFTKRMLLFPLAQITEASRRVAAGDNSEDTARDSILEFDQIRHALTGLVEQKVSLERDNIQKAYQKDHALLQYYQLQTRSHFFLNALKSIYNLTTRGELEKTSRIITLFSNHIRYVFHDSLTYVPLRAELDETEDYYQIIQMERATPILLSRKVPEELLDFPVPPLCIQTFLENFNKCNVQGEHVLRFTIRVDRIEMDGVDYVRIRLSDNGIGFTEEALRKLQEPDGLFEQYHVGIQNLRRRMGLLYHDRFEIAFFNNPTGGACSVLYLPADSRHQEDQVS